MSKNIKITEMKEYLWNDHLSILRKGQEDRTNAGDHVLFGDMFEKVSLSTNAKNKNAKIQTVFLTLLHLANEKNLVISNTDEEEIQITMHEPVNNFEAE